MSGGAHFTYRAAEPVELEVDVVVVGSGAGGATAAARLARGGLQVALVEAGAWRDPEDYPSSAYGSMRDMMDNWGATVAVGRALWPVVQGRCVGGTTVINSAICVRTPEDIFARWQAETGIDGDHLARRIGAYQDELEQTLAIEVPDEVALGRSNRLARAGALALGFDSGFTRRYARGCAGSGQCLQGCKGGRKQSLNLSFVPEVLARGGTLLSCAPVERVLFAGRRAVGVRGRFVHPLTRGRGARFTLRARRAVIVAASVTKTAPLLMRSGVKHPALGSGFRAHPGSGVFGVYHDPIDMNRGATQGWASIAFRRDPGLKLETLAIPPELVASRLSGAGTQLMRRLCDYRHLALWIHAVRAESTGRISAGLLGPVIRYSLDRADMVRFREGMFLLAKMHVAAGAKAVIPNIFGLPYALQADEIDKLRDAPLDPRAYVAILSHLFGGCTLGANPQRSVVDARGRVHGYEALIVADASVIPSNLGVNPQHTIMALAMSFADALLDDPPRPRPS